MINPLKVTLGHTKFKIRIVYKSGYYHDFWVYKFDGNQGDGSGLKSVSWIPASSGNDPVFIGLNNIESVYQINYRRGLLGRRKV